jgi:hypothetical protein
MGPVELPLGQAAAALGHLGLGRGQHRGIFCFSCLNGRLMLRG